MRWFLSIALAAGLAGFAYAAVPTETQREAAPRARTHAARPKLALRPPQFIVVSFDGSGGERMWTYWRSVGRRAHAHFTFFVSGVYLVDWAHRLRYRPPRHDPGTSAIGFAFPAGDLTVARTLRGIEAGYEAGDEV